MHDAVGVTVFERAAHLSREFASASLAQSTVRDDVVEHLAAVDVFEDHVVVMGVHEHRLHAADVRVMKEEDDRGFSDGPNLFREIFRVCFRHEGF